ncbi:apolipoprotein N-acyltransferase [soil metagenome]
MHYKRLIYLASVKSSKNKLFYILPGLLLFAAWPVSPFTFLIFIALVPLFWLEANTPDLQKFFFLLLLNLFVWNLATTWWIWNASPGGAVGAIVANSMLMCFPWMLYRLTKKHLGQHTAFFAFAVYWLSFEYIHHTWDLSWPWLTFGNVFATHPNWVQWYEYTGTTGGSLWVLLVNILLFNALFINQPDRKVHKFGFNWKRLLPAAVIAVLPLFASIAVLINFNTKTVGIDSGYLQNVVVVQPNVEPYTEKFNTDPAVLIEKMIGLSEGKMDSNTRLVVWPETAIPIQVWENEIASNRYYQQVFAFAKKHPKIQLITGIDSYKNWGNQNRTGFSIRTMENGTHYEAFNTAFATDSTSNFLLYHKTKLVPGVESLPSWLGFMSSIFDDLGGTTGSLGRSDSAIVFSFAGNPYHTAPIICYESIYSNYVTEYVKRGANLITIITNDGWWGETPGYKQHMSMAALRAIENRRWVARSANTGISCFINPQGQVIDPQPWNTAAAIKQAIPPSDELTFYSKNGDWLSRLAWPLAILVLAFLAVKIIQKKWQTRQNKTVMTSN